MKLLLLKLTLRARTLAPCLRTYRTQPTPFYPKQKSIPHLAATATARQQPTNDLDQSSGYIQREPGPNDQIVVAMSSGVDSSVCAALYSQKYKNVHGIYMSNWSQDSVCTERDWRDVQLVCTKLGITSERINLERDYWDSVFAPMIERYRKGLTPNPDVGCNKFVKFGKLVEYLDKKYSGEKKWWLVTGHYARVMQAGSNGEFHLLRGLSTRKDQSYYLSSIPSSILPRLLLPLGHQLKETTREMAKQYALHVRNKPDSQGLCFVNSQQSNFREFLSGYIEPAPGNIVTQDGQIWGRHQGIWHATIGQKSSTCMPQGDPSYQGVWFVSEKNVAKNEITIVRGHDHPALFKRHITLVDCEWIKPLEEIDLSLVSFQYHSLGKATIVKNLVVKEEENGGVVVEVELAESVRAVAPGQQGVLYLGNQVLGGGMISTTS
ncbi:uncharacterized protein LODBEIA_P12900 [Lodderomyces beijingensis]|uniref:tRNA-5-taurinomethyluridine 2-sulfurtransferase n=1 Tax=Lodderomyces beijingensis TaxID=1775926 RepID=A0ABP0ZJN0_9ASCO